MITIDQITRYRKNGKMGIRNKNTGRQLTDNIYDDIQPIKCCVTHICAKLNNKWAILDCSGIAISGFIFDSIDKYDVSGFIVRIDGKLVHYKYPHEFSKIIRNKETGNFIDHKNENTVSGNISEIIEVDHYSHGNKKIVLQQKRNEIISRPKYDDIKPIKNTSLYVKFRKDKKWGVITRTGELILKPKYDDICFYNGKQFTVILNQDIYYTDDGEKHYRSPQCFTGNKDRSGEWKKGELDWSNTPTGRVKPEKLPYTQTKSGWFSKKR